MCESQIPLEEQEEKANFDLLRVTAESVFKAAVSCVRSRFHSLLLLQRDFGFIHARFRSYFPFSSFAPSLLLPSAVVFLSLLVFHSCVFVNSLPHHRLLDLLLIFSLVLTVLLVEALCILFTSLQAFLLAFSFSCLDHSNLVELFSLSSARADDLLLISFLFCSLPFICRLRANRRRRKGEEEEWQQCGFGVANSCSSLNLDVPLSVYASLLVRASLCSSLFSFRPIFNPFANCKRLTASESSQDINSKNKPATTTRKFRMMMALMMILHPHPLQA